MVEEMLAARGISVTHETIRQWGLKFGREFANRIRQCGTVKLAESKLGRSRVGRVNGWDDDDGSRPDLRWLSLPRGDHQLRGVAVFSVPVEPAHGRGDAGRPRHLGDARDDPAVGP